MEIPITQLPPGDPRLVDVIVGQLKSRGIFDQLRKECLADVDTKPAFLNLRQRVDGQVKKFLGTTTWKNDLNKNHLRDGVRKNIQESGILDAGIDAIINQVVTPKIKTLILPYVESTVYAFLQIEKPKREIKDYDIQHAIYMDPPPVYPYGNPVPMPYPSYENPPLNVPKFEDCKFTTEIYHKLPEKVEPVVSSESDISVGGKSPMEQESLTQPISDIMPMETDAISSEEDDILSRKSPSANAATHVEPNVKIDEDNAVDSFDTARGTSDVVSRVEKLNIKEDLITESTDIKDPEISKTSAGLLFDHQSLDSISSNSSGLSFSPPTIKKHSTSSNNVSQESTKFSKKKSEEELRSTQSTPLIDEKSPLNESINSSDNSKAWAPYTLPKDLSSSERLTIASFETAGSANEPTNVIGGISPVSTENSQDSIGVRSIEKETSAANTEESHDSKLVKSEKSEGEVTSSSSSLSSPELNKGSDSKEKISYQDSNSAKKDISKHRSHSQDKDKHKSKDSRQHSKSHSKSKHDDHSSYRDKEKHHRRDKDDDKDRDKHSSSRGHHHRTSLSISTSSKSVNSTNESGKDKKERSSDHHKSHSKHSSSKISSSRRDSKHEERHCYKSSSSGKKSEKIAELKSNDDSSSKSKSSPVSQQEKSEIVEIKVKKNDESKNKRILKDDENFLIQLTKNSKKSLVQKPILTKENGKSKADINLEKDKFKKDDSVGDEKAKPLITTNDKEKLPLDKIKITLNQVTKNGEIKTIKNDNNKLNKPLVENVTQPKILKETPKNKVIFENDIGSCDRSKTFLNKNIKSDSSKKKKEVKFDKTKSVKSVKNLMLENDIGNCDSIKNTNLSVSDSMVDGKINVNTTIREDDMPMKNDESNFGITLKNMVPDESNNFVNNKNSISSDIKKLSIGNKNEGLGIKKFSFAENLVLEYDTSSCDSVRDSEDNVNNTISDDHSNRRTTANNLLKVSKSKPIAVKRKPIHKYDNSSNSSSSSEISSYSSDSESPKSKKKKVTNVAPKESTSILTEESGSSDESIEETNNVVLKKITIPVFSFSTFDRKETSSKINKVKPKKLPLAKRKKVNVSDQNFEISFGTSSDESEFEGFANGKSPKLVKKVKRRLKSKKPFSNSKVLNDSDSSDMDISILQFCKSKASKLNDFEGFCQDFYGSGDQSSADQKLKYYLSKFNPDSYIELDDDDVSDEDMADSTVFAATKSSLITEINETKESAIGNNAIPLVAIEENSLGLSASDNDSSQSSVDIAKVPLVYSSTNFFYSAVDRSINSVANVHDDNDVTFFSSNCDIKDVAIQSTSESSIDSLSTTSDNYFLPKKQILCNLGKILNTPVSDSPKRKLTESSNGNATALLPISKKRRILNAVRSEMEENLAKDNIIINSYSLLTPEEDRSGSKEYEVDLSQRVNSYCPLSPASDSSAEDMKSKNNDKDAIEKQLEPPLIKET